MKLLGIFEAIRNREFGYKTSRKVFRFFEKRRQDLKPFANSYIFDNRQTGSENLMLVLLGFQPYYWDVVLDRVKRNTLQFKETIDVCLCVPCGVNNDAWVEARRYASKYNFSFLRIELDLLAQAQNTAIKLHPQAKWIYKIDEDIILSDNYLSRLKETYNRASKECYYPIGFISPLININAGGFRIFLKSLDLWDDFSMNFPYQYYWSAGGTSNIIHENISAALYIWNHAIPFDKVAERISRENKGRYSICPIRMSIGAILFTRDLWNEWGGFDVLGIGVMGAEETQICAYTINHMQAIIIAEDILVGHLGFGVQKEACKTFFENHIDEFKHI